MTDIPAHIRAALWVFELDSIGNKVGDLRREVARLCNPDPEQLKADHADLLTQIDQYLTHWEISQDGMGPWPNDPDGGELRFVMAIRDIVSLTNHPDVIALIRQRFASPEGGEQEPYEVVPF